MGICWWIYFWFDALFSYHFLMWFYTYLYRYRSEDSSDTQHGFFGKDVIELKLSKIRILSYSIPGFSGEIFKFGTIVIQTFVGDLVIKNVEHPDKIYNKLQDAVEISTKKEDINEESIES